MRFVDRARDIAAIGREFEIAGEFAGAQTIKRGHINDTFVASYRVGDGLKRYVLQRINQRVFKNPVAVMDNIASVTGHIRKKLTGNDIDRRVLTLVPARDGRCYHVTSAGDFWRTYQFIENAHALDIVETPQQAFQAARQFGLFQQLLADLPAPRLAETIPDFHNTPKRFAALENAIAADAHNRAKSARVEIDFALRHKAMTDGLLRAGLPERVTHNDTKFNNVMFDDITGEGLCVLDLDTVMPGLALYDFGDMVRTTTSRSAEDERDLSKVRVDLTMYEALVRGYLSTAGDFLTDGERALLVFAGKLITFETGIRFLTDHLEGDRYFRAHRAGHNLDRCRTQFALVESIEQQEKAMQRSVVAAMS
jgi:Ser/Thr protein kinase RdoA (MazF antagonist)